MLLALDPGLPQRACKQISNPLRPSYGKQLDKAWVPSEIQVKALSDTQKAETRSSPPSQCPCQKHNVYIFHTSGSVARPTVQFQCCKGTLVYQQIVVTCYTASHLSLAPLSSTLF